MIRDWSRVVTTARWGALGCAFLLSGSTRPGTQVAIGAAVLIAITALATVPGAPSRDDLIASASASSRRWAAAHLLVTSIVPPVVVALTGGWSSPLLPCVLPPVLAAGLAGGFAPAAAASAFTVVTASHLHMSSETVAWAGELLLLAVVAAHARRIELGATNLVDLEIVNHLLSELNGAARSVALSADPDAVAAATAERVAQLFRADRVDIRLLGSGPTDETSGARVVDLHARGVRVGTLVLDRPKPLTVDEQGVLAGIAAQAGLAIDNARQLARLRALAVQEERARIARELHDRFGQELAGLGFMLDRIAAGAAPDTAAEIAGVRESVRDVVARLREALTDLRTEVTDGGLASALSGFLARVERRSGIATRLEVPNERFPAVLERELLRIAQEAVVNAERHSKADEVVVRLTANDGVAKLVVIDNGTGLAAPKPHHYGLVGMRERASAIGGELLVQSTPAAGTVVECTVTT